MATSTSSSNNNNLVFDPPPLSYLHVANNSSLRYPVRRIYGVGKNYEEHVVEMGGEVERSKPVFLIKPSIDGVVSANNVEGSTSVQYPPNTQNYHYEVELVVAIGKEIENNKFSSFIENNDTEGAAAAILPSIYGYAVGLDMTRRDLQKEAKDCRGPWTLGKYFDQSAPIGPITTIDNVVTENGSRSSFEHLDDKSMTLKVNGETKQSVQLKDMIWNVPEIIVELSKSYDLKPGDLIMTGTPKGVGAVKVGDRIVGSIDDGEVIENVDVTLI